VDGWHVAPSALGRGDDVNPSLAETGSYPTLTEADQKDGDFVVDGATIGDIGHAQFRGSPRRK
jgi:hypothetical protein